jgi:hypothetical protein
VDLVLFPPFFLLVLKAVDTVGIRYVKGSKDYEEEMKKELGKLNEQGIDW